MTAVTAVLDAWAALALLRDEPAAERVELELRNGCACSWINLGEVLYIETRRLGGDVAAIAVEQLADNLVAEVPDAALVRLAAEIKAPGGLSYADCFAVATAERHGVPLLTGDPEIVALQRASLEIIDLRLVR